MIIILIRSAINKNAQLFVADMLKIFNKFTVIKNENDEIENNKLNYVKTLNTYA